MLLPMDRAVGRVLERLDVQGIADNTLVVFISDHGGVAGRPGKDWADNGEKRAGKGTMFEGGLRTPMLVRWPNLLKAGGTLDGIVSTLDLMPTMVSAAAGSVAPAWQLDGVDLMPYLTGERDTTTLQTRTLFWRQNDMWAMRCGPWMLHKDRGPREPALYNLTGDPHETVDLPTQEPQRVAVLRAEFDHWASKMESPRFGWWKKIGPKVE